MRKEIIEIEFVSREDRKGKDIEEDGLVGYIEYHYKQKNEKYFTKIYLIDELSRAEDLAHELGHFLQFFFEEKGIQFEHDEELAFALEDFIRKFIREKLY